MKIPKDLMYTDEHEWVAIDEDIATIGITDFAQSELGDVVFVELPTVGSAVTQMEPFGTIEAVKAVSDLYAPLSGEVVEINEVLADAPETINKDPYGDGWFFRIDPDDAAELDGLMDAEAYAEFCENEEH